MVATKLLLAAVTLVAVITVANGQERLREKEPQREKAEQETPLPAGPANPSRLFDVKKIIKNTIDMMKTYTSPENLPIIPIVPQQQQQPQNQTPAQQYQQQQQGPVQISSQHQPTTQTLAYPQQPSGQIQEQQQYAQQSLANWFAPPSQQDMKKLFHLPADIISRLASDAGYIEKETTTHAPYSSNGNSGFGGFNFNLQNNEKSSAVPATTRAPPPPSGFVQANEEESSVEKLAQQQPLSSLYGSNVQYIPVVHNGQILLQPVRIDPSAIPELAQSAALTNQQQPPIPASILAQQQQNAPFGAVGQFAVATNQVPGLSGLNKDPNQPPVPVMRTITTLSQAPALQQQQQQAQQQQQPQVNADQLASLQETLAKLQTSQTQLVHPQVARPLQYNQQQYQALYNQYYQQQQQQQQQQEHSRAPTQVYAQYTGPQEQQQEQPIPTDFSQYRQAVSVQPEHSKQEPTVQNQQLYSTQQQQQYYGHVREPIAPQPTPVQPSTTQQPALQIENGQEIIIGGQKYILNKADISVTATAAPGEHSQSQQFNNLANYVAGQPAPLFSGVPFIPAVPTETHQTQKPLIQKTIAPPAEPKPTTTTKSLPYQKQYNLKELEDFYNVPSVEKVDKDGNSAYPKHKQVKINFQYEVLNSNAPRVDSIIDSAPATTGERCHDPSDADLRNARIENLRRQFQLAAREAAKKTRKLQQREKESGVTQVTTLTTPAPLEVSEQQCVNIVSFARRQGADVRQYAVDNCLYLNNYNKKLTCENVSDYVDACYSLILNRHRRV